jgi:hypothetical protein
MHGRVLETREPYCMPLQLSISLSLRPTARGEPWNTGQRWSLPLRRGVVQSRGTRVCARALIGGEVGSDAEGCVAVPEPS